MKKKIVNLIVSAAVVTSMMFAVTACGVSEFGNGDYEAKISGEAGNTWGHVLLSAG